MSLAGKRIFITGGSRGIGLAIALKAAADGASIAIAAKTAEVNPKLPGTIYSAAAEIEAAGGVALPIQCDLRDEDQIAASIAKAAETFGAAEAKEMGLVSTISDDVLAETIKIANQIAQQPPQAIINTKALLKASKHDAVEAVMKAEFQLFSMALQSEEAMMAFMNFMSKKGK